MAIWSNRILILLGALGIFLSGILAYSSWQNLMVPCGGTANCTAVMQSDFAVFLGVNVSYIGLVGYVGLFALALLRSTQTGVTFRRLGTVGFVMSVIGLLFSLYLTFVSLAILHLTCRWCLFSLGAMLVTTIVHAALLQADEPEVDDRFMGFAGAAGALIIALGASGLVIKSQEEAPDLGVLMIDASKHPIETALPDAAKVIGGKDAKVTIIEFADINCGTCRSFYPDVKAILKKHGDGLRLGFRNFPLRDLEGHETSGQAAIISELAAERGEFWKYMDYIMNNEQDDRRGARIKTIDGLVAVSAEIGYTRGELATIFSPTNDEQRERAQALLKKVASDSDMALAMRVATTPTFIIYAEGHDPKPVSFKSLDKTLMSSPYIELIRSGK